MVGTSRCSVSDCCAGRRRAAPDKLDQAARRRARRGWTCSGAATGCWPVWARWPRRNAPCQRGQRHCAAAPGRPGPRVRKARPEPGLGTGHRRTRVPGRRPDARPERRRKTTMSNSLRVPSRGSGRGRKDGTPVVQQHASAVATAAEGVAPAVRTAQAALDQHRVQLVNPAQQAAPQKRAATSAQPARSGARS